MLTEIELRIYLPRKEEIIFIDKEINLIKSTCIQLNQTKWISTPNLSSSKVQASSEHCYRRCSPGEHWGSTAAAVKVSIIGYMCGAESGPGRDRTVWPGPHPWRNPRKLERLPWRSGSDQGLVTRPHRASKTTPVRKLYGGAHLIQRHVKQMAAVHLPPHASSSH